MHRFCRWYIFRIYLKGTFFFFFLINLFILFIYFWLHWVFVAVHGLSLVAGVGATLRYSVRARSGFSCCRARDLGMRASVVVARGL